ncbi:DUF2730 family protein [Agrobacterium sp. SORGH_AS 787]|uniref:DUF2730 family protein n=1 Tax=Agrobacterium sp. SORGH_AS 787 TaxID=3041775 RepID=UPI000DE39CC7|nr:type II secretory pathway component PulJ [Rhizobium sp. SORGH_AS_0787]
MTFDLSLLTALVALALSSLNLFVAVRNIMSEGEKKLAERMAKAETTLINHDRRIQKLENDLTHMPDRETTHRLEITLERMLGRLDTMDEKLKPIASTNHRLQEYLLENADK